MKVPKREELESLKPVNKGRVTIQHNTLIDKYRQRLDSMNKDLEQIDQLAIIKFSYRKKEMLLDLEKYELLRPEEIEVLEFYKTTAGGFEVILGPISERRTLQVFDNIGI